MAFRMVSFILCFSLSSTVVEAKVLKVVMGSKLPPMHFVDGAGKLSGFEVDLVNLYAGEQGAQAIFLDPGKYNSSSLDLLLSGKADMAVNCMTITDERKQVVDFSEPYFDSGAAFLSRADFPTPVDFYRRSYVTVKNSLYAKILAEKNFPVWREVAGVEEALVFLKNEKLPKHQPITVVYDWTALQRMAEENRDLKLADFLITQEKYGAAFKRGNSVAAWNDFLKRVRRDGRYDQLLQKWFKGRKAPSTATIPAYEYRSGRDDRPEHPEFEFIPGGKVAEYLPILNAEPQAKISNKYYDYLVKHYDKKWLPYLEELFFKDYPRIQEKFYSFVLDKDITDMLPAFYKALGYPAAPSRQDDKMDGILISLAKKHPELRPAMIKAYDNNLQHSMHLRYSPGIADENGSKMEITIAPDRTGEAIKTITVSMENEADLTVLPGTPQEPTRITINGITGTLKEMTISGDTTLSIVSVEKGGIASVGLPDHVEYSGMSSDGKIMYLSLGKLRLLLDVETENIFRIEFVNPLVADAQLNSAACGKPDGPIYYNKVTSDRGEVYYIGYDAAGGGRSTVYKQDKLSCKTTKLVQFPGSMAKPVIMDNKLFSSDIGYDSCTPFNVVDLRSGLKLDTGSCGGIVPVGPHELLYCGEGGWIINTETLMRRKIAVPACPGSTGELLPHPLPGYYIYRDWMSC